MPISLHDPREVRAAELSRRRDEDLSCQLKRFSKTRCYFPSYPKPRQSHRIYSNFGLSQFNLQGKVFVRISYMQNSWEQSMEHQLQVAWGSPIPMQHSRAMQTCSRTIPYSQYGMQYTYDTSLIPFPCPRAKFSDASSDNSHSSSP